MAVMASCRNLKRPYWLCRSIRLPPSPVCRRRHPKSLPTLSRPVGGLAFSKTRPRSSNNPRRNNSQQTTSRRFHPRQTAPPTPTAPRMPTATASSGRRTSKTSRSLTSASSLNADTRTKASPLPAQSHPCRLPPNSPRQRGPAPQAQASSAICSSL
ncbi:hypothetical protein BC831DRAFT_450334 [Entophlyctis helioformis]|nr:hypothetical protein BC831DRAFT_450334 [Entophlyctis helioformis]